MKRLLLVVAACGSSPPPAPPKPAGPSRCERIADHLVGMIGASQAPASPGRAATRSVAEGPSTHATPEQLDPFRRVIANRCSQDRWSDQAQQCLLDAPTLAAGDQCDSLFTAAQKQALATDGQTALSAMPQGSAAPK